MTNNTLAQTIGFANINSFDTSILSNSSIYNLIICINIHVRKLVSNIFGLYQKIYQPLPCYKVLVCHLEVNHHPNWNWFSYIFHHNHLSYLLLTQLDLWFCLFVSSVIFFPWYFIVFFPLPVGTSVKYLFPLLFYILSRKSINDLHYWFLLNWGLWPLRIQCGEK